MLNGESTVPKEPNCEQMEPTPKVKGKIGLFKRWFGANK